MPRISDEKVQEIRAKADIVSVVGQYIPLTKKGKNYVALCPFHDDHNPSLSISSDKQIYKCFVCHAGGNVFTFVSQFEKISFIDAVIKVAKEVSVDVGDVSSVVESIDPIIAKQLACLQDANHYLTYQLHAADGLLIKDYLTKRGISEKLLNLFEIGYNPPNNAITTFLLAKKHDTQTIVDTNIGTLHQNKLHDVFDQRVTFPIRNVKGQIIGFTARTVLDDESSKYINTATTKLYTKSEIVYNIDRAKDAARKEGYVILVEGVMDVVAYARAQVYHVVSTLGTALTKQQIDVIKKASYHVVLSYDYDDAGLGATYQVISQLVDARCQVEVVVLPTNTDPDDLINKEGAQALCDALSNRQHWMEFVLVYGQSLYHLSNYQQKKKYLNLMINHIKKLSDAIDRKHFATLLSKITEMDINEIFQAVLQPSSSSHAKIKPIQQPKGFLVPLYEKEIIAQMLISKQAAMKFQDNLGYLSQPEANQLALMLIAMYRVSDTLEIADVLSKAQEQSLDEFVLWLLDWPLFPKGTNTDVLDDAILHVQRHVIEDKIQKFKRLASQTTNPQKKAEYVDKMIEAQKEIHQLRKEEAHDENI